MFKQYRLPIVGCPSETKFCRSTFCFPSKLTLGLITNSSIFFFLYPPAVTDFRYIVEMFDDMGMKDPEVGKFRKNKLTLSRPRFNLGAKQKSELQNFVLEGHPTVSLGLFMDKE